MIDLTTEWQWQDILLAQGKPGNWNLLAGQGMQCHSHGLSQRRKKIDMSLLLQDCDMAQIGVVSHGCGMAVTWHRSSWGCFPG